VLMPLTLRPCIARLRGLARLHRLLRRQARRVASNEDASANTALVLVDYRNRRGSRRGNARYKVTREAAMAAFAKSWRRG